MNPHIFRKNRKAFIDLWLMLIGVVVAIGIIIVSDAINAPEDRQLYLGQNQLQILRADQEAQKILFYIDQSANYAAQQALHVMAVSGGLKYEENECGSYLDYNLWQGVIKKGEGKEEKTMIKQCFPEKLSNAFGGYFNTEMSQYLGMLSIIPLDYDTTVQQKGSVLKITGNALKKIEFPIYRYEKIEIAKEAGAFGAFYEYEVPKAEADIIKKIYQSYKPVLEQETQKYNIPLGVAVGLIYRESGGDPFAISPTGAAGLSQFTYGTGKAYKDIFVNVVACCDRSPAEKASSRFGGKGYCLEEQARCKAAGKKESSWCAEGGYKCNPQNDGRFNPELAIKAKARLLSEDIKKYEKKAASQDDQIKLGLAAYNAGSKYIDIARKWTGKGEPTWAEVREQIKSRADEFDSLSGITNKWKETSGYPDRIWAVSGKFDEMLAKGGLEEKEEEKKEREGKQEPLLAAGKEQSMAATGSAVNSITGFASDEKAAKASKPAEENTEKEKDTESKKEPSVVGRYSLNPSFTAEVEYDLGDYGKIKNIFTEGKEGILWKAAVCENENTDKNTIEECLDKTINEFNEKDIVKASGFTIYNGPCSIEENVKSDFAEYYRACMESADDDCICSINIKKPEDNKGYKGYETETDEAKKEVTITAKKKENMAVSDSPDSDTSYLRGDNSEEMESEVDKVLDGIQPYAKTSMFKDTETWPQVDFRVFPGDKEKKFLFYKKDEKLIFIEDGKAEDKKACEIKKRTFKFCVEKNSNFYAYDEKADKIIKKPLQYKFAFVLGDNTPPPPIKNIEVFDKPVDEGSVIVKWEKSEAPDTAGYTIFYDDSEESLAEAGMDTAKNTDYMELNNNYIDLEIKNIKNTEQMPFGISLSSCRFDYPSKKCYYQLSDSTNIELERERLYYFKDSSTGKEYYVCAVSKDMTKADYSVIGQNIADNKEYVFGIAAYDLFGNMIGNEKEDEKIVFAKGKSIDDLPPDKVETPSIKGKTDDGNAILKFGIPLKNIDSNEAKDIAGFEFYCSKSPFSTIDKTSSAEKCGGISIDKCPELAEGTGECESVVDYQKGYAAVAAVDDDGNKFEEVESVGIN